jgi:hypothetical protein
MAPELPDPAFAKVVVLTPPHAHAREELKHRLRAAISEALVPEASVRVTQLVFGPYTPSRLCAHEDSSRCPPGQPRPGQPDVVLRFVPDQERLNLIGLSPSDAALQMRMLLTGFPVTQVRDNIRNVPVVGRSAGETDLTLRGLPTFL